MLGRRGSNRGGKFVVEFVELLDLGRRFGSAQVHRRHDRNGIGRLADHGGLAGVEIEPSRRLAFVHGGVDRHGVDFLDFVGEQRHVVAGIGGCRRRLDGTQRREGGTGHLLGYRVSQDRDIVVCAVAVAAHQRIGLLEEFTRRRHGSFLRGKVVGAQFVTALLVELPALAARGSIGGVGADDFRKPLEAAEERWRRRVQIDQHRRGPVVLERVADPDRRFRGERTVGGAMGKKAQSAATATAGDRARPSWRRRE